MSRINCRLCKWVTLQNFATGLHASQLGFALLLGRVDVSGVGPGVLVGSYSMGRNKRERVLRERLRARLEAVADDSLPLGRRKRASRQAAGLAERLGILRRPRGCRACGVRTLLERHHPDHLGAPLRVVYLCRECHRRADISGGEVRGHAPWGSSGEGVGIVKRYRKRPVVVEAYQWNPVPPGGVPLLAIEVDDPNVRSTTYQEVQSLLGTSGCSRGFPHWSHSVLGVIETREGLHLVSPGDWIIRGTHGEVYPCKPEIFAKIYEPVAE